MLRFPLLHLGLKGFAIIYVGLCLQWLSARTWMTQVGREIVDMNGRFLCRLDTVPEIIWHLERDLVRAGVRSFECAVLAVTGGLWQPN